MKHNHSKKDVNKKRKKQLKHSKEFIETDGINSLNYKLKKIVRYSDYTHIFVELTGAPVGMRT